MVIGYDAKKAVLNQTGIGNYSRRCINSIAKASPESRLLLFAPTKRNEAAISTLTHDAEFVYSPFVLKKGLAYELWRNFFAWRTIRSKSVQLFHGLSNELPFGISRSGCKSIVTIHDLIFLHHPELYTSSTRQILKWKTRYACRVADHIIAVSEKSKQDIISYYQVPAEKITVVYQSYDASVFNCQRNDLIVRAVRSKYQLPEKYVLCVGTIERRKNQEVLIKVLPMLDADIHVLLVGKQTPYQAELELLTKKLGLTDRVHILNKVQNGELPVLYQEATVFAYMSLFEGFGIPIVEALACGVPVIAATGSCLEEAGGPQSAYLAPADIQGLAQHIKQLINDELFRQETIRKGFGYVQRFTDEAMAHDTLAVYQKLLKI